MADYVGDEDSLVNELSMFGLDSVDSGVMEAWKERLRIEARSCHLQQVQDNETSFLCLGYLLGGTFCPQSYFDELVAILESNDSIEHVTLDVENCQEVAWTSWTQLLRVFRHISPRITTLTIPNNNLSPYLLSMCLWQFRCLKTIDWHAVSKDVSSWDRWCAALSDPLQEHPTLESFSLKYKDRRPKSWPVVDGLALALVTAPNLREIHLTGCKGRGNNANQRFGPKLKTRAIIELIRTRNVHVLEYSHLGFCREGPLEGLDWTGLSEALQMSGLKELSLNDNELNVEDLCRIAQGLQGNTQLEVLSLSGNNFNCQHGLKDAVAMLSANQTLKKLDLSDCELSNDGLVDIAELLNVNTSLEHLYLDENQLRHGVSDSVLQAFSNALEMNMMLKVLQLDWAHICPPPRCGLRKKYGSKVSVAAVRGFEEIQAFLYMNRTGRSTLLRADRTATRKQWVDALSNVDSEYSLNILFYLIKANPSLCDLS